MQSPCGQRHESLTTPSPTTYSCRRLNSSLGYVSPIEFELRPNVTFHDGSKFTADDVVYTVNLVLNDKQISVPSNYSFIDGAEKIDDLHVRNRRAR